MQHANMRDRRSPELSPLPVPGLLERRPGVRASPDVLGDTWRCPVCIDRREVPASCRITRPEPGRQELTQDRRPCDGAWTCCRRTAPTAGPSAHSRDYAEPTAEAPGEVVHLGASSAELTCLSLVAIPPHPALRRASTRRRRCSGSHWSRGRSRVRSRRGAPRRRGLLPVGRS